MLGVLLSVTSIYAIFLSLMLVYLAISVIRLRVAHRVSLSDGGHNDLRNAIRILGNFSEYVPISLILMAFCEINNAPDAIVHLMGLCLVIGRVLHWVGMNKEIIKFRQVGMLLTFTTLIGSSLLLAVTLIF